MLILSYNIVHLLLTKIEHLWTLDPKKGRSETRAETSGEGGRLIGVSVEAGKISGAYEGPIPLIKEAALQRD